MSLKVSDFGPGAFHIMGVGRTLMVTVLLDIKFGVIDVNLNFLMFAGGFGTKNRHNSNRRRYFY